MRRISKHGLKKPHDNIVFDIPETSVEERMAARSRSHRALAKGARHIGSVPSYRHGNKLIIPIDALIECIERDNKEDGR
ncbi:MAG: hypothetical protein IKW76_11620 [Clostridia bacterium]|nr:hypothetical protein [Clostridia bacterium]